MRMISFSLTTPQFIAGTKDVTRRMGWLHAEVGMELMAVEKAMGLGKGGKVRRLGLIRLIDVRRECLGRIIQEPEYGRREVVREGFPEMSRRGFMEFFCDANGCDGNAFVTRLEFVKLPTEGANR